jgi:hypothetical protein
VTPVATYDTLDNLILSTSQTTYNLTKDRFAFTPASEKNIICSINGVVQSGNFTVLGSTITFTNVSFLSSDKMDYIMHIRTAL